ncbi:30S ribosomal subunit protein S2 [Candidatus Tremblaya phenacola PAVE]|nr:30S ribosomal subunit protein S2 [Candidatus Tremblaya phenacola PAVE]
MAKIKTGLLFEAGVHLGHEKSRWHPSMSEFVLGGLGDVHYLDVRKTILMFKRALRRVGEIVIKGKPILFVCSNPKFIQFVRKELEGTGILFVCNRWLGGTLTNFPLKKRGGCQANGSLRQMPGALFLVGVEKNQLAVKEARRVNIPIFAVADSNDPVSAVEIPIPGNDDSILALQTYMRILVSYFKKLQYKREGRT